LLILPFAVQWHANRISHNTMNGRHDES
jgi:hypothetical protein